MKLLGLLRDRPKPLLLSPITQIVPPRARPHSFFYSLYRLLAILAFFAVAITLSADYLARRIENEAKAKSREMSIRLSDVSQLNEVIAASTKSSLDLMDAAKREGALAEMNADVSLTALRLAASSAQFLSDEPRAQAGGLLGRFVEAQGSIHDLSDRIKDVVLRSGDGTLATDLDAQGIRALREAEGNAQSALARLREEMSLFENEQAEQALAQEESVRNIDRVIGSFLILIVASASLYGLRIARVAQVNALQKDEYLERLKISEDRFQTMAENMREVFWMTAADMRKVIYVSPPFERIYGQTCESRCGDAASFISVVHHDDRERVSSVFLSDHSMDENPKEAAFNIEYRILQADGSVRWMIDRGFPILDHNGKLRYMVGCSRDITGRIEAEEALRESETRYKGLVESAFDGVVVHRDGIIETANQAFASMCGYTIEEVVGKPLMDFVTPDFRQQVQDQVVSGSEVPYESVTLAKGGSRIDVEVAAKGCVFQGRQARITAIRNITERKQAERMKSDFVSFVTHQLRTPLAGIKWMLELAEDESADVDEMKDYVRDGRASAERLITLVNELLDVSRLEQDKLTLAQKEVDLRALTNSVLAEMTPLIRERDHTVSLESGEGVSEVIADPDLVRQVVLNFVSNAVKYTKSGGSISIRIAREDRRIRWEIKDSGIGIPKEAKAKMFQKFYRAANVQSIETEGTGLGLYFVRLILERMGGDVSFESEEGQGSTFLFTLPLAA